MFDDTIYVGNVGREDAGTYLDVRCGDAPVHVGQSMWTERDGNRLTVTVNRIRVYGLDFDVLHPGTTARVWVGPSEIANLFADGTKLHPGEFRER